MTVRIIGIRKVKAEHDGIWFDHGPVGGLSRDLPPTAYTGPGGTFFITTSTDGSGRHRHTIHCQRCDGGIAQWSKSMAYRSKSQAEKAAKRLAADSGGVR